MNKIKIHVMHTGKVCISPYLAFGGDHCNLIKASGVFLPKSKRIWLPVSAYYIEHPKGKVLVDCGWSRDMSPKGVEDSSAQIRSLNSHLLYHVNQGILPKGKAIDEQLKKLKVIPEDLDYVLLTHLDCDHANGLKHVAHVKQILVSQDELNFAKKHSLFRYKSRWWKNVKLTTFQWNGEDGPVAKSFDLFGDGSITLINIPGHSAGMFAVTIKNEDEKFVLLCADGGYAKKSWQEMIPSGIASDKQLQRKSLEWIRLQSEDSNCIAVLASHDPDIKPQVIEL